ncbi:MAG: hypothetical protein Q4F61_02850 [Candidatus Saccharibacteria bacterium]|nr:hypothetical protein [Candidatus Saccharibacteria bacterium]
MANVDRCTRYAEAGLCGNTRDNALKITRLDDSIRNLIFRGKDVNQIEAMLCNFSDKIKKVVSEKFGFECKKLSESSNNNKDGADLYTILPSGKRLVIEVKFGAYTDKAPGMGSFSKIFGTSVFTEALSNSRRKAWIEMIKLEYPDLSKQWMRTINTLNQAATEFNKMMAKNNHKLSKESQEFMEDYLLNNSGDYASHTDNYIRFEVSKDGKDIDDVMLVKKGGGTWYVEDIALMDQSDKKPRINIIIHNDTTNLLIKFTLNNKNSLHLKNPPITVRSKYMVNPPSFNAWIRNK